MLLYAATCSSPSFQVPAGWLGGLAGRSKRRDIPTRYLMLPLAPEVLVAAS